MTIEITTKTESTIYENAQRLDYDSDLQAFSVVPESGEGFSVPLADVKKLSSYTESTDNLKS